MILVMATLLLLCSGFASGRRHRYPGAPAALRIRPPPMVADPISPDCYNFTVGNWKKQEFYSPNYPGEYINNTDCVLYLEAPSGFTIQLDFRDQFNLEHSDDCKYDFLEVRDGPFAYSPLVDRFCGAGFPPLIESTDRFLWLRFRTDDLLQYGGFRAIYSYHKDHTQDDGTSLSKVMSTVCRIPIQLSTDRPDGVLRSEEVPFGDVSDPNYPRNRPVDCTWEIFTEQGNTIHLQTRKMARGGGSNPARCDLSYVALYQGTTLPSDRKVSLCGDDDPGAVSLTSSSNRVYVRLYGNALHTKPQLDMVYSLVNTGESCQRREMLSCGSGSFCVPQHMICNGLPNCPDGRDEEGCPAGSVPDRRPPSRPGSGVVGRDDGDGGDDGGGGDGGPAGTGDKDDDDGGEEGGGIPMHMIILAAVGGVVLTCICLSLCIMCRSRRQHARKKRQQEQQQQKQEKEEQQQIQKSRQHSVKTQYMEMTTPTPSTHSSHSHHHPHPTHSLSRHPKDMGGGVMAGMTSPGQGQGQPQGRYRTFASHAPPSKDNTHRYSFTGPPNPDGSDPNQHQTVVGDLSDSGQYRRFLTLEMTPDLLDDPSSGSQQLYVPHHTQHQQGVMGMTHLPSPTSPHAQTSLESGGVPGGYPGGMKYPPPSSQWSKAMLLEDPSMMYPYTSSLPRPTPFLGLSKPFQPTESKYLKSMQALKVMDEEIMKETPPS